MTSNYACIAMEKMQSVSLRKLLKGHNMYYPELKFFPPVITVFGDNSGKYPTSVALLTHGAVYHWYVKPNDRWLDDEYFLSSDSNLHISYLEQIGECSSKIFDQLLKLAFGYTLFYTLDLRSTTVLMQQLNCETIPPEKSDNFTIAIKEVTELVPEHYQKNFIKEINSNPDTLQLNPNYASDTCVAVALTALRLHKFDTSPD